jgi:hypothetical protein
MAQWTHTINLVSFWERAKASDQDLISLSSVIAKKLSRISNGLDEDLMYERNELIEHFEEFSERSLGEVDRDDFDRYMTDLYDWGRYPSGWYISQYKKGSLDSDIIMISTEIEDSGSTVAGEEDSAQSMTRRLATLQSRDGD